MLSIKDLHVAVAEKKILNGINLQVNAGEVHAIMGPNGSGKSTLSNVLAGREDYRVTRGCVSYKETELLPLCVEERAQAGIFLAFQYPVELPGVANINFLKTAVNAVRTAQGKSPLDAIEFLSLVREKCAELKMDDAFLYRSVNEGFSGGEKKRNEILQMTLLQPSLAILDETDSGLDIDALKIIGDGVNALRDSDRSFIVVTHYQRLLDYIKPDYVHVLAKGQIVKSGDYRLALELEEQGYSGLTADAEAVA